jgi:DUF1365 family protein
MHSALYVGNVHHRRFKPVDHRFRYRVWLAYLDLEEVPELVGRGKLLSDRKFAAASFLRTDHVGDPNQPLAETLRGIVAEQTGCVPRGPIRLLTLLRHWGYHFSPLNLFYCFDSSGTHLDCVVAEVSNTPWHERHCYVLWEGNREERLEGIPGNPQLAPSLFRYSHPKAFHVSPFMDMEATYHWQVTAPGGRLVAGIANSREGKQFFQATMNLERKSLDRGNLLRTQLASPWMSAKVTAAIYYQALILWMKRCPYYPHPKHGEKAPLTTAS